MSTGSLQRFVVTDADGIAREIRAMQEAAREGVLQLTATATDRCVGAIVALEAAGFVLRTVALRPAHAAIGVTRGPLSRMAAEVASIVDSAGIDDGPPAELPSRRPRPVCSPMLTEDALLLADIVRSGDPARLREALDLAEIAATPGWLRDLAFGARLRLTACLLDATDARVLSDVVATEQGWGELDAKEGLIHFDPLTGDEVRDRLRAACDRLMCQAQGVGC